MTLLFRIWHNVSIQLVNWWWLHSICNSRPSTFGELTPVGRCRHFDEYRQYQIATFVCFQILASVHYLYKQRKKATWCGFIWNTLLMSVGPSIVRFQSPFLFSCFWTWYQFYLVINLKASQVQLLGCFSIIFERKC
jgi:hypothetical protein